MSAIALPSRQEVEDFLYREAALLDEWRLEEWLEILTDDAIYQVPSTDAPEGDARNTLYIIADDALRIRSRVKQLLGKSAWAENSHSRTRRMITNVSRSRRRRRQYRGDRQLRSLPDAVRDSGYLRRPL
jgi:3-phenylpropionate/cinnamic acid dioxygenase small subunit